MRSRSPTAASTPSPTKIDVEPSGEAFNEISLDPDTERPRNPMINAGAITSASLVAGADPAERFERIRQLYSRCAGTAS